MCQNIVSFCNCHRWISSPWLCWRISPRFYFQLRFVQGPFLSLFLFSNNKDLQFRPVFTTKRDSECAAPVIIFTYSLGVTIVFMLDIKMQAAVCRHVLLICGHIWTERTMKTIVTVKVFGVESIVRGAAAARSLVHRLKWPTIATGLLKALDCYFSGTDSHQGVLFLRGVFVNEKVEMSRSFVDKSGLHLEFTFSLFVNDISKLFPSFNESFSFIKASILIFTSFFIVF